MRFCPFCSAENADNVAACQACGRRLPPLPARRAGSVPASGVQLPPRPTGNTQPPPIPPRRTGTTAPPPLANPMAPASEPAQPASAAEDEDAARRSLLNAISPGPAAQRREPPLADPAQPGAPGRRRADLPVTAFNRPPTVPSSPGIRPPTSPPPNRKPPTNPPPNLGPPRAASPAPPRSTPAGFDDSDFKTLPASPQYQPSAGSGGIATAPQRASTTGVEPPPTRVLRPDALVDRPFTPPKVDPVPEIPDTGLYNSARYAVRFARARWQRRGAIKELGSDIKQDTDALDQVLGALGRVARTVGVEGRVFHAENTAITAAEERAQVLDKEHHEGDARRAEENSKFVDVERERNTKLSEAERMVDEAVKELSHLEGQRRSMREKRKELERRQKAYLRAAEDNDKQAGNQQMGDARQELRRSAESHRKEAAALEPERQEVDRRLASLERPIGEATAKLDAAKAELDAAKRSLADAREGHNHRLAELDGEQKRKSREMAQADAEIQRRLVTLGTLVNLNRIDDERFAELYQRVDRLRGAITARTTEIEKLTAEREAYDRGTLVRGISAMGGAIVAFIALIVILRAIF
ncbi:MAG: hypothetical protein AB7O24_20510 [Kofleriaceae bacterium]